MKAQRHINTHTHTQLVRDTRQPHEARSVDCEACSGVAHEDTRARPPHCSACAAVATGRQQTARYSNPDVTSQMPRLVVSMSACR